jgi:hypothetical protein
MAILESKSSIKISWGLQQKIEHNFIDIKPKFHLISCITGNEIKIYIKNIETDPTTFYGEMDSQKDIQEINYLVYEMSMKR